LLEGYTRRQKRQPETIALPPWTIDRARPELKKKTRRPNEAIKNIEPVVFHTSMLLAGSYEQTKATILRCFREGRTNKEKAEGVSSTARFTVNDASASWRISAGGFDSQSIQ